MKGPSELQRILECAYRDINPQSTLVSLRVTSVLLDKLVPPSLCIKCNNPPILCRDIESYRAHPSADDDDDARSCRFMYFATAMIHVFTSSATAYIVPNDPIAYVWINVVDHETVQLVNYSSRLDKEIFRVVMHVVHSVNRIDTVKISINLHGGGRTMPFSMGNAVQVCLRLDLETPNLHMTAPNPLIDCVLLLSYKGEFMGAWHKGKEKLICVKH
jgi:hypothetical protein